MGVTGAATAGCAACGACCDPVPFTRDEHACVTQWSTAALEGVPDPAADDGWAVWLDGGWTDEGRDTAITRYDPAGRWRQDADFIAAHWTPEGDTGCKCDQFNPATRLCTARDTRPPVCRDYPWYSDGPGAERAANLFRRCSYLADVPPDQRGPDSRPLIPLAVVRTAAA